MDTAWLQQIQDLERRAHDLNLSLGALCSATGMHPSNLSRWKAGRPPSMRSFTRVVGALQTRLAHIEYATALKLIDRINPAAAPRIRELLEMPTVGAASVSVDRNSGERDSQTYREAAGNAGGHRGSGTNRAA